MVERGCALALPCHLRAAAVAAWSVLVVVARGSADFMRSASVDCGGEGYLHLRLCEAWEDRRERGLVAWPGPRDEAAALGSVRSLGGHLNMVAQSAPGRGKKRSLNATQLNSTRMPFDGQRFHFGKVDAEEVLLCFNPRQETACQHTATQNTCHLPQYASINSLDAEACGVDTEDPAVVMINKNPVCRNHIILVPGIKEEQPQVLTQEALALGLAFAMRASSRMWLSFNSIGAGASVNHLHLQGFFPGLGVSGETIAEFPLEVHARTRGGLKPAAQSRGPISLLRTKDWPVRGWAFTWDDEYVLSIDTGLAERRLAEFVHAFVAKLQAMDMAHNVLISSGGRRVIVFPRRILFEQSTDVSQLQVAGHEVAGWWIVAKAKDELDEVAARALLLKAALPVADEKKVTDALQSVGWQLNEEAKRLSPDISEPPHTEMLAAL